MIIAVGGKRPALGKHQRLVLAIAVTLKVGPVSRKHREALDRVAQSDRHRPVHHRVVRQALKRVRAQAGAGLPHLKHRIEQQVGLASSWPHNQIGTGEGLPEAVLGLMAQMIDPQKQRDTDTQGQ